MEHDDVRKAGVERRNSKKGFNKNDFVVSDCTFRQYLKLACSTQKIQSLSNRSKSESRNPRHAAGAYWHTSAAGAVSSD